MQFGIFLILYLHFTNPSVPDSCLYCRHFNILPPMPFPYPLKSPPHYQEIVAVHLLLLEANNMITDLFVIFKFLHTYTEGLSKYRRSALEF